MILAKSFTIASILCLSLLRPTYVNSSRKTQGNEGESLSDSSLNASKKNGTSHVTETEVDDDFPQLSFFIKDVLTTPLGKVNRTADNQANGSRVVNLDVLTNDTQSNNLSRLNYETFWHNGSLTLTLVDLEKNEQNSTNSHHDVWDNFPNFELEDGIRDSVAIQDDLDSFLHSESRRHRRRRALFGFDDRIEVSTDDIKQPPYSAVVKINTGCTGTLISPEHVLTAAHCVHDGMHYIIDVPHLKVGVLRRPGKMRWIRVDYVKVPRGWTLSHDFRYDYSVLKLHRAAPETASFLEMYDIPEELSIPLRIQFASFPSDKADNTMWYSYCKAHCYQHAILNRCDSYYGSSGAGIYGKIRKGRRVERFIMGVFSGLGNRLLFRGKKRRMNVGTKITPIKLAQIRSWLAASPPNSLVAMMPTSKKIETNRKL